MPNNNKVCKYSNGSDAEDYWRNQDYNVNNSKSC